MSKAYVESMDEKVEMSFLSSENGVMFDKNAYKSIASATSLEEIEQYVIKMID